MHGKYQCYNHTKGAHSEVHTNESRDSHPVGIQHQILQKKTRPVMTHLSRDSNKLDTTPFKKTMRYQMLQGWNQMTETHFQCELGFWTLSTSRCPNQHSNSAVALYGGKLRNIHFYVTWHNAPRLPHASALIMQDLNAGGNVVYDSLQRFPQF